MAKRVEPAALVAAVRGDRIVGRGSCSVIDECYTDQEVVDALARAGVTNRDGAVRWARRVHRWDVDRYRDVRGA